MAFSKDTKIENGDLCKCIITGFTGVVTSYATHLSNCDRVGLQPRDLKEDGGLKDAMWFDLPQVELIEKAVIPVIDAGTPLFNNGDDVKHKYSPYKGKVTGINVWSNGCIRIGVLSSALEKGTPIDTEWFPQQDLDLIAPVVIPTPAPRKPGGPMKAPKAMSAPR